MSTTSLLAAYIVEEQATTFDQIVGVLLQSGQGLQDVIELLEQDLTSSEDRIRSRATLLIAQLLEQQSLIKVSSPVLHLFVVFFSRRMQDYASISPCLTALTTILKLYATHLDPKYCDLLDIIHSTSKFVHIPSYAQNVRQKALELLRLIIDDEELVRQLRGSGGRLLEGLANCIEGEKDPRCLLIGLRSIHLATVKFAANLDETIFIADEQLSIAEHVFDVVSRYYPISFAPPADDPIGITSEVLAAALDDCICQTKAIATFAISFLIDQLILEDSESRVAALNTLSRIIREHGVELLIAEKLMAVNEGKSMGSTTATKMIIDHAHDDDNDDDDHDHTHDYDYRNGGIAQLRRLSELLFEASIHEASERILTGIYQLSEEISRSLCSSPSIDNKHPIWQIFVEGIIAKVLKEVQSTGLDNLKARGAWRLCRSIGQGGGFKTYGLIIEWFFPTAMKGVEETAMRLEVNINRTLKAIYQQVDFLPSLSAQDRIQPGNLALLDGIIQLSSPLEGGLDVSGMQEFQLLSQDRVVSISTLLAQFLQPFAVEIMPTEVITGENRKMYAFDDDTFIAIGLAIGAIRELLSRAFIIDNATLYHQLIKSISVIAMDGMKYFISNENVMKSLHHIEKISPKLQVSTRHCLESLAAREKHIPALLEISYSVLVSSSDDNLGLELIANMAAKENGVMILQHLITQLTEAIAKGDQRNVKKFITGCYAVLNNAICVQIKQKAELFTITTSPIITQLIQISVVSNNSQEEICLLLEKIMQQLVAVEQQMSLFASILDIINSTDNYTSRAILLRSTTIYLDKTAPFFSSPLVEQVLIGLQGGNHDDSAIANQAVAIIINKMHTDGLQRYFSQANISQWSQSLLVWTTKATILRPPLPHPTLPQATLQSYLLDGILNGLDSSMASRLQVLVSESDGMLEKSNRGYYSPFWQQKLFSTFYPRLKEIIYNGDGSTRVNGMLSFCYVVHGLSVAMLRVQLEEVVDTIVYILSWLNNTLDRSMHFDTLGLLEAQVVPAMTRILQEQPVAFVDHLQTILPRLLQMAKKGGEARLRIAAIDCLASLPSHVPYSKLHPYKMAVLRTLQTMLDDKKRVVRQKAALVRNDWMLK